MIRKLLGYATLALLLIPGTAATTEAGDDEDDDSGFTYFLTDTAKAALTINIVWASTQGGIGMALAGNLQSYVGEETLSEGNREHLAAARTTQFLSAGLTFGRLIPYFMLPIGVDQADNAFEADRAVLVAAWTYLAIEYATIPLCIATIHELDQFVHHDEYPSGLEALIGPAKALNGIGVALMGIHAVWMTIVAAEETDELLAARTGADESPTRAFKPSVRFTFGPSSVGLYGRF